MCSFDIYSLYTNIPLNETIDIILTKLFDDPSSLFLGLTKSCFQKLLQISVLNNFFIFDNKLYRQKEGLAMGLPHSPAFANIFLCHHEQKWLDKSPVNFKPHFYRRYMDDTFLLFDNKDQATKFLNYLNSQHPNISFTSEYGNDFKLSFLDTQIFKTDNKFHSTVYRKNTFSGLGLSYFSFCSFRFKINAIKSLLYRAFNVCSDYFTLHNEFEFLKSYFTTVSYTHLTLPTNREV